MRPAVELSYLDEETQRDIVDRIDETEAFPSHDQAIRIRKAFEAGEINYNKVQDIMAEEKPNQKPKFKFSFDRLKPYIPKDYNDRMAEDYVIKALEHYQKFLRKQREQARYSTEQKVGFLFSGVFRAFLKLFQNSYNRHANRLGRQIDRKLMSAIEAKKAAHGLKSDKGVAYDYNEPTQTM